MKHTYSAGGVVLNKAGNVLLVNEGGSFWGFPKGRKEQTEERIDTAKREMKEEAGISQVVLLHEFGTYERHPFNSGNEDKTELKHITMFLFIAQFPPKIHNQENNEIKWFAIDDVVQQLTQSSDKKFFEDNIDIVFDLAKKHCSKYD